MKDFNQHALPAITNMKDYEKFLESDFKYCVLMDFHIAQLKSLSKLAKRHNKEIIIHVDLIHGLNSNEYGAEFLCQEINPVGLISTRSSVIHIAKKKGKIAIQRVFLIDQHALTKSYDIIEKMKPDYIEVLPGLIPEMIAEINQRTKTPIIVGGLIRTTKHIKNALDAGAIAVTTSNSRLWDYKG